MRALRPAKSASRFTERPRVRNKERAGALRRFLIDTYGLESLASGAGPLDSHCQAGRPSGTRPWHVGGMVCRRARRGRGAGAAARENAARDF